MRHKKIILSKINDQLYELISIKPNKKEKSLLREILYRAQQYKYL